MLSLRSKTQNKPLLGALCVSTSRKKNKIKLYPEYSENIIAYVISGEEGHWYVTDKELWFLDRISFAKAFGLQPDDEDVEFSKNISFGDGSSLIHEIYEYKTTTEELRELIKIYPSISEDESILEMRPSLYVDLDKRML